MPVPIYLAKSDPSVYDPTDCTAPDGWFPACPEAALLVVCVEAIKDIVRLTDGLDRNSPAADRRGITLLSVPIVSIRPRGLNPSPLGEAFRRLYAALREGCVFDTGTDSKNGWSLWCPIGLA